MRYTTENFSLRQSDGSVSIISSYNCFSPIRYEVMIWVNFNWTIGNQFSKHFKSTRIVFIQDKKHSPKKSWKSVHTIVRYVAYRQTDRQTSLQKLNGENQNIFLNRISNAIWRRRKAHNQWQHSFQMKAALILAFTYMFYMFQYIFYYRAHNTTVFPAPLYGEILKHVDDQKLAVMSGFISAFIWF